MGTVTCYIGGRSQEMGGHWLPNAQPVGGAGRGYKWELSLHALKIKSGNTRTYFSLAKGHQWLATSKDNTSMILLNVKNIFWVKGICQFWWCHGKCKFHYVQFAWICKHLVLILYIYPSLPLGVVVDSLTNFCQTTGLNLSQSAAAFVFMLCWSDTLCQS